MKNLVLCVCVLILAPSSSTELKQKLKSEIDNLRDNLEICVYEQGLSRRDMYTEEEIMTNVYSEPANAEKTRKYGCFVVCVLKKLNLMEGATIKEAQIHAKINETFDPSKQDVAHKIARKCLKKARNITQECEKSFSLYVCIVESVHKLEHEEHVKEETEEVEETEQQQD